VIPAGTRVPWSRDDLLIVCGQYFTLPFGQMHARNPRVIELARILGRTPSSVAMKLVNLASLDPAHQARGIKGLANHTRADEVIWREFQTNGNEMTLASETRLEELVALDGAPASNNAIANPLPDPITEVESIVVVRTMQGFFRKVVMAAYNSTCCITGNPVPGLLVASHILPWSDFPAERLNPRNGLCLTAHFDRAFDRGLVTLNEQMRLVLSPSLRQYLPNKALESEFVRRAGQTLARPDRFAPDPQFIAHHRSRIFRAS
jgi:putative restriction endonuclease